MKLKSMCFRLLLPLFLLASAVTQANEPVKTAPKADPTKGQAIAGAVCVACHNADGNSTISTNPKLAGQSADYLYKQLKSFKSVDGKPAERPNAVMMGMTSTLSDEDMRNVAAWFASQTIKAGKAKDDGTIELGQKLYRAGDLAKGMPACAGCHGPTGSGIPVQYPRIGGQHADYIEAQLKTFRTGERANASMHIVALKMTDAEIKAVSNYIAGLH
jgi:cytochrome c553